MNPNQVEKPKRPTSAERPFPWRCRQCGKNEVMPAKISYEAEVPHDGRVHHFTIPHLEIPICRACEKKVFTENVDCQINAALRSHLRLLTPQEIKNGLAQVMLNQKEAAERLGVAEATLSRWINESQIQSRAMDNLLRVFFAFPQVRKALTTAHANMLSGAET